MKSMLLRGNVLFSGFVAFFIALFFALGAIGDATSLTPEFFIIIPIWGIGTVLIWKLFSKVKLESISYLKVILGNLLLWITIPIGFIFAYLLL